MKLFIIVYSERHEDRPRERIHSIVASSEQEAVYLFKNETRGRCRVLDIREV